ncbi:Uncharacterised protein [Chlamydia trachomatis]|nr:Uncharacterised protein [Chlamydia trachomatis]
MAKRVPRAVAEVVVNRAMGVCEVMFPEAGCNGRAEQLHHRKLRSQGGGHSVHNLVHICHNCHNFIHSHPGLSYDNGWLVHSFDNPEEMPFRRRGGFVQLLADGDLKGV